MIHKKVETAYIISYIFEDGFNLYPVSWKILEAKGNYSSFKIYGRTLDIFVLSPDHQQPKEVMDIAVKDNGISFGYINTTHTYPTRIEAIAAAEEYYKIRNEAMEEYLKNLSWNITRAKTSHHVHWAERKKYQDELREHENKILGS